MFCFSFIVDLYGICYHSRFSKYDIGPQSFEMPIADTFIT